MQEYFTTSIRFKEGYTEEDVSVAEKMIDLISARADGGSTESKDYVHCISGLKEILYQQEDVFASKEVFKTVSTQLIPKYEQFISNLLTKLHYTKKYINDPYTMYYQIINWGIKYDHTDEHLSFYTNSYKELFKIAKANQLTADGHGYFILSSMLHNIASNMNVGRSQAGNITCSNKFSKSFTTLLKVCEEVLGRDYLFDTLFHITCEFERTSIKDNKFINSSYRHDSDLSSYIMHIIIQHMIDYFGEIPTIINTNTKTYLSNFAAPNFIKNGGFPNWLISTSGSRASRISKILVDSMIKYKENEFMIPIYFEDLLNLPKYRLNYPLYAYKQNALSKGIDTYCYSTDKVSICTDPTYLMMVLHSAKFFPEELLGKWINHLAIIVSNLGHVGNVSYDNTTTGPIFYLNAFIASLVTKENCFCPQLQGNDLSKFASIVNKMISILDKEDGSAKVQHARSYMRSILEIIRREAGTKISETFDTYADTTFNTTIAKGFL